MHPLRLLVLDAYAPEGRKALSDAGGTEAGPLYRRLLRGASPGATVAIAHPADPDPNLPSDDELRDLDGVVWTGSSLTIRDRDDPRVATQVRFARRVTEAGVPSFGSCWAAQLATVAAGGRCERHPRGREFGVARDIRLSPAGRDHPLFRGKPDRFEGFTSHEDHVVSLPETATLLASNPWSRVQAVSIEAGSGRFWAVQYHPEYDLHEVASLCRLRLDELVAQGTFPDHTAGNDVIAEYESLHADPDQPDLAARHGLGPSLLDPELRTREVRNWLESLSG